MKDYIKKSKTAEGWQEFMDEWVYSVSDRMNTFRNILILSA